VSYRFGVPSALYKLHVGLSLALVALLMPGGCFVVGAALLAGRVRGQRP
jgi:hypothetical protein